MPDSGGAVLNVTLGGIVVGTAVGLVGVGVTMTEVELALTLVVGVSLGVDTDAGAVLELLTVDVGDGAGPVAVVGSGLQAATSRPAAIATAGRVMRWFIVPPECAGPP